MPAPSSIQPANNLAPALSVGARGRQAESKDILKSTVIVSLSSIIVMAVGLVRTKVIALVSGPPGVGLFGLMSGWVEIIAILTSFGLGTSGIRRIAQYSGAPDQIEVSKVASTLKVTTWATGGVGCLLMIGFSHPAATWVLKAPGASLSVAILGLTILFRALTTAYTCVIQGLRRITDLAIINILGAVVGTLLTIPLLVFCGPYGIPLAIVAGGFATLAVAAWYTRRLDLPSTTIPWRERIIEAGGLIRFGAPVMLSAVIGAVYPNIERLAITRSTSLAALGQYQAASSISTMLATFVLTALSTDFYPRLASQVREPSAFNASFNQQLRMSVLLAFPGLMFILGLAPHLLSLLYTTSFIEAAGILRLLAVAVFARVLVSGFRLALLAQGRSSLYLAYESTFTLLNAGLLFWLVPRWGVLGAAWALTLATLAYAGLLILAHGRSLGFCSRTNPAIWEFLVGMGLLMAWASWCHQSGSGVGFVSLGTPMAAAAYAIRILLRETGYSAQLKLKNTSFE
ncbi:oligosaccharide flippase family protein [Geothrix paludis]|uniref:oligosaccharide flippase family protein n=1 Tax=Geothrix paludis TaxID=2922722 RepID=UPI001FAB65E3|nr:oligosaccharide flippase family protein [Geothrix paludis]